MNLYSHKSLKQTQVSIGGTAVVNYKTEVPKLTENTVTVRSISLLVLDLCSPLSLSYTILAKFIYFHVINWRGLRIVPKLLPAEEKPNGTRGEFQMNISQLARDSMEASSIFYSSIRAEMA